MRAVTVALVALVLTPIARSEEVVENPQFCSPNGEFCVVVPSEPPAPPEPARAAVYRRWPSGNQELLYELVTSSRKTINCGCAAANLTPCAGPSIPRCKRPC